MTEVKPENAAHEDLTWTTLTVLFIGGLLAASIWVMRPFLPAIVWAVTLVITTWPMMLRVQRRLGNRRGLAGSGHDDSVVASADPAVLASHQHNCEQCG